MKIFKQASLCVVVTVVLFEAAQVSAQEFRVWTQSSGQPRMTAAYVSQTDKLVIVVNQGGKVYELPKEYLSKEDQALLATLPGLGSPYIKFAASSAVKRAVRSFTFAQEMKIADTENRRLQFLELPQVLASGASYSADCELRKRTLHQIAKPKKIIRTDQEIAVLREQLLAPTPAPTFVKELEFSADWKQVNKIQLSENGRVLAALLPGNPPTIEAWDLNTGKKTASVALRHFSALIAWKLSPQGNYLAYEDRENQAVVVDLQTQQELHSHRAALWADEPLLRLAFDYAEKDVYFLTKNSTLFRFPIGGGRGCSIPLFPEGYRIDNTAVLDVSEDGDYVSCLVPDNIRMATPLLRPSALRGLDPNEKTSIDQIAPVGQAWSGKVLNHGIVTANRMSRDTLLIHECKDIVSGQYSVERNKSFCTSRTENAWLFTDRAQRYVWKLGRTPTGTPGLDIYDLSYFSRPLSVELPAAEITTLQTNDHVYASPESKRFVKYNRADKKVYVFKLTGLETPPMWKFHAEIRRCLLEDDFALLDKLVEPLFLDMRQIPGGTGVPVTTEAVYEICNNVQFYETSEVFQKRIRDWQIAAPKSILARLVVANHAIVSGFAARGSSTADKVTEEGWRALKKLGLEAEQVLAPLLQQEKPPAEAYLLQLRVALMLGHDIEKQMELADGLMKIAPEYYPFHQQMILNLLPRWGGQVGDCEKYASHLAAKLGAEKGEIMYGRLAIDLMKYHTPAMFKEETNIDIPRAFKGLLLWDKNSPNDPEASLYVMYCYMFCERIAVLVTPENKADFLACKKSLAHVMKTMTWNPELERHYSFMSRVLNRSADLYKE